MKLENIMNGDAPVRTTMVVTMTIKMTMVASASQRVLSIDVTNAVMKFARSVMTTMVNHIFIHS
jgi:hypothetical protein